MGELLGLIIALLIGVSIAGLYHNNDLARPTTWIYYLCCLSAGLIAGIMVGDLLTGLGLGVFLCLIINYVVSIGRWQRNIGKKLDNWNKRRNDK